MTNRGRARRARSAMTGGESRHTDIRKHAARANALEYARTGGGHRIQPNDHQPDLACFGLQPHRADTFKLSPTRC